MIGRFVGACCAWMLVMGVAPQLEAQRVSIEGSCVSEPHRAALVRELTAVRLEIVDAEASVRVILDDACHARVEGAKGPSYEVTPGADVSAWAVRVAETAYALSPYAAPSQPEPAPPEPPQVREPRPPSDTHPRWLELAASLGPTWVSGTQQIAARFEGRAGVRLSSWLWLTLRGGGTFPALRVGESPADATVRLAFAGLGASALLWGTRYAELEAMLGIGALRLAARGDADAPRINRDENGYAAFGSLGLAFTYLPSSRVGLRAQAACDVAAPELVLDLGASRSDAVARTQLSVVLGPLFRF